MNVTAVVVTRDRPGLLEQTLDALAAQSYPLSSVIVVDNASGDDTRVLLAARNGIVVHRLDVNTGGAGGFAVGVHQGVEAGADWIWLLDDDAVPHVDALEHLVAAMPAAGERVGALCSAVHEFGGIALQHRRYFHSATLREPSVPLSAYDQNIVPVDTASFVGFLLNARAAESAGIPNSGFFLAYDDTEYSLRLGNAGWRVWLVPTSLIDHKRGPQGRLRHGPFGAKHYYNLRNQLAVKRHYGKAASWRLAVPIVLFGMIALRDCRLASLRLWYRSIRDSRDVSL
ncbi:glycosyltransferase [Burkholderia ubonensis]|uniref:Glycosyl transferase family 2 n=1 Tax=Burkholderia ubonensis TaxID=101571 RepID=A0ABD6Q6I4_9BURK|nr:glycosyltransferase [Burkholderia ubonensis]OJA48779.1 glycosyl transferase family 2 [Burkholderia ubonensis]